MKCDHNFFHRTIIHYHIMLNIPGPETNFMQHYKNPFIIFIKHIQRCTSLNIDASNMNASIEKGLVLILIVLESFKLT